VIVANGAKVADAVKVGTGVSEGAASAVCVRAAENVSMASAWISSTLNVFVGVAVASPPPHDAINNAHNPKMINLCFICSPLNEPQFYLHLRNA
jgi:hypothetical protein